MDDSRRNEIREEVKARREAEAEAEALETGKKAGDGFMGLLLFIGIVVVVAVWLNSGEENIEPTAQAGAEDRDANRLFMEEVARAETSPCATTLYYRKVPTVGWYLMSREQDAGAPILAVYRATQAEKVQGWLDEIVEYRPDNEIPLLELFQAQGQCE